MLSVQSNPNVKWENKVDKAFWRGRDSRRERLNLIKIARKYPDFINASLTNFFFFRDEEEEYGPKEDHISFFRFFDVKLTRSFPRKIFITRLSFFTVQVSAQHWWNCRRLSLPLPVGRQLHGVQTGFRLLRTFLQRSEAWCSLCSSESRSEGCCWQSQMGAQKWRNR